MDPRYMDTCQFDTLSISPLHHKKEKKREKKEKKKRSYGRKVGPDILRLVSLLGLDKS